MSTNALMHEPNNELYVFDVCSNCETVFNKLVVPEIRGLLHRKLFTLQRFFSVGKVFFFVDNSQKKLDLEVNFVKNILKKTIKS
jgi:hypothetical protein